MRVTTICLCVPNAHASKHHECADSNGVIVVSKKERMIIEGLLGKTKKREYNLQLLDLSISSSSIFRQNYKEHSMQRIKAERRDLKEQYKREKERDNAALAVHISTKNISKITVLR